MLLGTVVTLFLSSRHILNYGWALVILLLIFAAGMMQVFLARNKKQRLDSN